MTSEELEELREFVRYVATDWVELSHDKVMVQRDDYIRLAKALCEKYEILNNSERKFSKVSRLEVIGPESREYVRYFEDGEFMYCDLQDDDRTMKIFIGTSK